MKKTRWLALFSQTGSEIAQIADTVGRFPDCIITDNINQSPPFHSCIHRCNVLIYDSCRDMNKDQKIHFYERYFKHYDIITLHGWLNIVPGPVCEKYKIYNGHPGLINVYPELKGKDPQEKAWKNIDSYQSVGSVIHRVTAEIDGGDVLYYAKNDASECKSLEDTFDVLKRTSLKTWVDFYEDYLK